jgi:regulator of protease activity HflC (stomatin/prohibitin superfamily)
VAGVKARGQQEAAQMDAETEKKVATVDRQAAEIDAQRTVVQAEAAANAVKLMQEAKAELFGLAVKAFGDPAAYSKWQFAEGLPEDIKLNVIYAGPGTLWTDLKTLAPAIPVTPPGKAK